MEAYFVIYYDSKTGRLVVADETAVARFADGLIWDPSCEEWLDQSDYPSVDVPAAQAVKTVVDFYNSVLKQLEPSP